MLSSLHIENMAVIARMDVDFAGGLSAVTGETGAGKSVMIDALAFLLGGKANRELLRHGCDQGLVSAVFSDIGEEGLRFLSDSGFHPDGEVMLQRTLSADGRTQCRIDGRVIPLTILREFSKYLVSIHGQNDNQLLLSPAAQEKVLFKMADDPETAMRYRALYEEYRTEKARLAELQNDSAAKERMRDMLAFQVKEIDAAHLREGEEEKLLRARDKWQHMEKIVRQSGFAYQVLYGAEKASAVLLLEKAAQALSQIAGVLPEASTLSDRLLNLRYEAEDIAESAKDLSDGSEGDPAETLDKIEGRLSQISRLRRKYGADEKEILSFRDDAARRLSELENSKETEAAILGRLEELTVAMRTEAAALHEGRTAAADALCRRMLTELCYLDMSGVRFRIEVKEEKEFSQSGLDSVTFLLAANPGEPLLPLSRVASGGELARVMLALRCALNERDGVGTAVFDEVDTGISGKTARKIGIKLSEIGRRTQVLCITHSAQIASLADRHYKIVKKEGNGRAASTLTLLDEKERVLEIGRILGGLSVSEAQICAAAEMIEEGKKYR